MNSCMRLLTFSCWCLLVFCATVVAAEVDEEALFGERSIVAEADAKNYPHLFRLISLPSFPIKDGCFVIKLYMREYSSEDGDHGWVEVKFRKASGRIVERSRPLHEAEVWHFWEIVTGEELFSLSGEQQEYLNRPTYHNRHGPSVWIFAHRDKAKDQVAEVFRTKGRSQPAAHVYEAFTEIVQDLAKDIDVHEDPNEP